MYHLIVKKARDPTSGQKAPSSDTCVRFGTFRDTPVFHVSFPDLNPGELGQLGQYVAATGYITKQLDYPQYFSNFLMALSDCMEAASQKQKFGGIIL